MMIHMMMTKLIAATLIAIAFPAAAHAQCCPGCPHSAKAEKPESAEALLERLEHQAAHLKAFTADVMYEHFDDLLNRRETRTGNIIYKVDDVTNTKSFAVLFERLVVGNRGQSQRKHYIFADRWLVEVDHEIKQFIKREVVEPGRQIDPLKLGEGPIPLPIGQPKDEVLTRFEVSLTDLPAEGNLSRLQNVDGIRLIPKDGTAEADSYKQVDLFYDRETGLPVGILAVEPNDNRKTVRLDNVKYNPELTEEQLAKLSIEEPKGDWAVSVERLRASANPRQ